MAPATKYLVCLAEDFDLETVDVKEHCWQTMVDAYYPEDAAIVGADEAYGDWGWEYDWMGNGTPDFVVIDRVSLEAFRVVVEMEAVPQFYYTKIEKIEKKQ